MEGDLNKAYFGWNLLHVGLSWGRAGEPNVESSTNV